MNEPKRRGRPPKASYAVVGSAPPPDTPYPVNAAEVRHAFGVKMGAELKAEMEAHHAQAYALRVWEGQSVSAPREWRIERVRLALEGQNLPFEGVELPE